MRIESFFPGRLRVSSPVFVQPALVETVLARLRAAAGVRSAEINPRTGSLTLLYDPAAVSMATLEEAKATLEKMEKARYAQPETGHDPDHSTP